MSEDTEKLESEQEVAILSPEEARKWIDDLLIEQQSK